MLKTFIYFVVGKSGGECIILYLYIGMSYRVKKQVVENVIHRKHRS